ncbi:MAG: hypothetical protein OQL28_07760 [Sedimenticola sp.]|nr:hypothetical protein [Sedimenticola sp.]
MWVIIQQIPTATTNQELSRFLSRRLGRRGWLRTSLGKHNGLKSHSILRMTDRVTGIVECHGLAELADDRPEEETLKSLNGHRLNGRRVAVRKYYHRNAQSRASEPAVLPGGVRERRRSDLHIEMVRSRGKRLLQRQP